jgi:hypothetical protein
MNQSQSQRIGVTLRLGVYRQSVRLGDKPFETHDQIFQLNTCLHRPYVPSTMTRGWVCSLQLLLALSSAVIPTSGSHILLSQIRDSPNLEAQVPVFISPRATVEVLDPASTREPAMKLMYLERKSSVRTSEKTYYYCITTV